MNFRRILFSKSSPQFSPFCKIIHSTNAAEHLHPKLILKYQLSPILIEFVEKF